jgi:UDP-N-acetylmuramoylalanine--D-glutamate ligase
MNLRGKRAVVVGWARSGRAAAEALHERGAVVRATDSRSAEALAAPREAGSFPAWLEEAVWGEHPQRLLDGVDLVVVSPGVPPGIPLLAEARRRGIAVLGEVELAARLGRAPILGVTGTNGKSTVVSLLGDCFAAAGRAHVVAGNVGTPLVSLYPSLPEEAAAVVELSSYQLEYAVDLRAHGAVILNLQPDHLGRHKTLEAYLAAKARLLHFQTADDFAVLVRDDTAVASLATLAQGRCLEVSLRERVKEGAYLAPAGTHFAEDAALVLADASAQTVLMPRSELPLPGEHNVTNALAAAAAAIAWGLPADAVRRALRTFRSLPHRLEPVGREGGVLFVNDSKATNVDAALVALQATEPPFVLVAGGHDKGLDFAPLRAPVRERARGAVLTGESAERMAKALEGTGEIRVVETLEEAIDAAVAMLDGEGTVLFSPACSSFDRYRDFEDRGEAFRAACRARRGFRPEGSASGVVRHA